MAWLVLTFDAAFGISCRAFVNFRRVVFTACAWPKRDPILVASFDVLVQGPENKTILVRQDLPKTSTTWSNPNIENWSRDIGYKEKSKRKDLPIKYTNIIYKYKYTNIPQEEGTNIVCGAYEKFHNHNAPIPTHYLREMFGLILRENSFEFN